MQRSIRRGEEERGGEGERRRGERRERREEYTL